MPYIGRNPDKGNFSDLNGAKLILDADADTSITADTDDTIHIEIAGADDFQMTANTFTVLSGSTLAIASGATIANSGTATGFSSADPSSADGDSLGTASAEWSDLYLADSGVIYFGNDQDVTLTHDPDDGLFLKSTQTTDDQPVLLTLQTGETDLAANDVIGKIAFQAPDEGTGSDAILISAAIQARAEGDHSSSSNATSIDFMTGASEAAATKWSITSAGTFLNAGTNIIDMNAGKIDLDADADTSITADTDDQIDFEIGGTDRYVFGADKATFTFSVVGAFSANAGGPLALEPGATASSAGEKMGLSFGQMKSGGSVDDGTLIYDIKKGTYTSGESATASSDLVFEVLHANSQGERFRISGDGQVYINESDAAHVEVGLCINQGGDDNEILSLKSSDIAHGVTDETETDTYLNIWKSVGAEGPPQITGFGEDGQGLRLRGICTSASTTKGVTANAAVVIRGVKKSSAASAVMGSNENVMMIEGCTAGPGFIFDAEGSMHSNASNAVYDEYDDAELVRTIEQSLSTKGLIASKFDEFVQYSHEDLADAGLVGREDDGSPNNWINWMHLSKLHNGAIWQQYEKHANLLNAVYELASESVGKDRANEILDKHDVKLLSKNELLN